ncbi:MAG TPA: glutamine--fructose-6-phosphate transaminase (isomerizing) [Anaerolineae bacterium]|nr:glutamine--fructose-6-phosphate transaminase (isomerizing) [Anaerolineae bacterium]
MCGIVGYVGSRNATPIVFDGLKRLEYRGYDSAGIAVVSDGRLEVRREEGKLDRLGLLLAEQPLAGQVGLGHTRWATHGPPSRNNAHPHTDCSGRVVVIQNGIVENYRPLRRDLIAEGHKFKSETDTEVIVHLVERYLNEGCELAEAVRLTLHQIEGAHAIAVMSTLAPDRIVAARLGNAGGVTVGMGKGEMFLASDIPAILEHTQRIIHLDSKEMAVITADGAEFFDMDGRRLSKAAHDIPWDPVAAVKGEYRHFMQKEIHEQAEAIAHTIGGRVDLRAGRVVLDELNLSPEEVRTLEKVVIVSCGTSAYAGLVGKFMIEALARIPVEVDYGSEFRYRDPLIDDRTAVLAITQSGETVDTLAAMEEARGKGATLWSIVNVIGSQAARVSDGVIYMHAGPEIGVASTKAFTTSLVDLYLLGLYLGQARGTVPEGRLNGLLDDVLALPKLVGQVLDGDAPDEGADMYCKLADEFFRHTNFLYLGRGINYPIALEGALKLKEISYIHAEGYPAGEMKHGPIALIDERMPVVAIVPQDSVYEKMISQVEQVKARGGKVIAVATEGDTFIRQKADHVIYVPATSPLLSPVLNVVPLQLFAYHVAVRRGADVDQPRNLAKSVTVE